MRATFWAAYASRLYRLADRMDGARTPEETRQVLTANADLWAALEADIRGGLIGGDPHDSLKGTLLTRARTVAEQTRGGGGTLAALCLLNRQTALNLAGLTAADSLVPVTSDP